MSGAGTKVWVLWGALTLTMEPKGFPAVTMGMDYRWPVEQKVHENWGPGLCTWVTGGLWEDP